MQLVAVRMPVIVEPRFIIKANCVDYECIAIPFSDRFSHPRGIQIRRMPAAVGEDFAHKMIVFKVHHHSPALLKDLQRRAPHEVDLWYSRRETVDCGIIRFGNSYSMRSDIRLRGFEPLKSPWRHRKLLVRQAQRDLEKCVLALVVGRTPHTPPHAADVRCRGCLSCCRSSRASARTG